MNSNLVLTAASVSNESGGIAKVVWPLYLEFTTRESLGFNAGLLTNDVTNDVFNVDANDKLIHSTNELFDFLPSIIHDNGVWLPFHIKNYFLAKNLNCHYVVSPHGALEEWPMKHKWLKKKMAWLLYQKTIMNKASLVVVNSSLEYARLRDLGIKSPVAIIENGLELPRVSNDASFDQKKISKKALYLSRINPKKGILELLTAWKNSQACKELAYSLSIYGNSDDESYLLKVKEKILSLGLSDSVFLGGPVYGDDKWKVYAEHDFFILPSFSENFGIVVLEALYSGLPVISTENTPWKHLEQLGFGVTVSLEDDSLTSAIDRYALNGINSSNVDDSNAKQMRQYVIENYSWSSISEKYATVYSWLLHGGEQPSFVYSK